MIFWIHPVWQSVATLLAVYALALGCRRIQSRHFGYKTIFAWKDHVRWGRSALGLWMIGALLGLGVVRLEWGGWLLTGDHGLLGLVFLPLALFGYLSGHVMDARKKPRTVLPMAHGLVNICLMAAALWQAWSGWPYLP